MQRWAIALTNETRSRLGDEAIKVGSIQQTPSGDTLLVFRDRFSALRVASAAGNAQLLELEIAS